MKNLVDKLIKESRGWKMADNMGFGQDMSYSKNKPFLWFSTESEMIGFMSEKDIRNSFEDSYDGAEDDINAILDLEPGDMYDADGGINIYVRIK